MSMCIYFMYIFIVYIYVLMLVYRNIQAAKYES